MAYACSLNAAFALAFRKEKPSYQDSESQALSQNMRLLSFVWDINKKKMAKQNKANHSFARCLRPLDVSPAFSHVMVNQIWLIKHPICGNPFHMKYLPLVN